MHYSKYFETMFKLSALERLYLFYTSSKDIDKKSETNQLYTGMPSNYTIPSEYLIKNGDGISLVDLCCMISASITPELLTYLWDIQDDLNLHDEVTTSSTRCPMYKGYDIITSSSQCPQINVMWLEEKTKFCKEPSIENLARLYGLCMEGGALDVLEKNNSLGVVPKCDIELAMEFFELRTELLDKVLTNKNELNKPTTIRVNLVSNVAKLKMLDAEKKYYSNLLKTTSV